MPVRQVQQVAAGVPVDHKGLGGQLAPRQVDNGKGAEQSSRGFQKKREFEHVTKLGHEFACQHLVVKLEQLHP
jgi:hypothetical protein